jgi:3-methyladenine DNA glycosylase AlkD
MADALRELSQHTIKVFSENADSSQSKPMSAYMREQFPFLGIKSQDRKQLVHGFFCDAVFRVVEQ